MKNTAGRSILLFSLSVLLAMGAVYGTLSAVDARLSQFDDVLGFDETFRLLEFQDSPFLMTQFARHLGSAKVCERYRKVIVVFGASETGGTYEPYRFSPTFYLNRLLPKDVIAYNATAQGYFLHSQVVLQSLFLKHLNPDCHYVFVYGINSRTFYLEEEYAPVNFYGNLSGDWLKTEMDHVAYQGLPGFRRFPSLVGLIQWLKRPRRPNVAAENTWPEVLAAWKRRQTADDFFSTSFRDYKKTQRWYEIAKHECDTRAIGAKIHSSRQTEILNHLIRTFQKKGLSYYYYLHASMPFPAEKCRAIAAGLSAFKSEFPEAWEMPTNKFGREDYADQWHLTETGNQRLAEFWYESLRKAGELNDVEIR